MRVNPSINDRRSAAGESMVCSKPHEIGRKEWGREHARETKNVHHAVDARAQYASPVTAWSKRQPRMLSTVLPFMITRLSSAVPCRHARRVRCASPFAVRIAATPSDVSATMERKGR